MTNVTLQAPAGITTFNLSDGTVITADGNGQVVADIGYQAELISLGCTTVANGNTAGRPADATPGQMYFDTSLGNNGKPVWRNAQDTGWVDATGAAA